MNVLITSISAGGVDEVIVSFSLHSGEKAQMQRFLLSTAAYTALALSVGESSQSEFDAVEREANIYSAYKRALYLLSFGSSSRRALHRKLVSKGHAPEFSRMALDRLVDNRLLCENDAALRETEKCLEKLWGESRIRAHLCKKGYSEEAIASTFFALEDADVDFDANCVKLLEKKYSPVPTDKKELQKLIAALMRYGYSLSQIKQAISGS